MAIVIGILFLALGAALVWAVDRNVSGVDLNGIGVILLAVGGVTIFASLLVSARPTGRRGAGSALARDPLVPVPEARSEHEREPSGRS